MKIVNRQTFLSLPANTVFQKYEPCAFGAVAIKGDTVSGVDFCAQEIDQLRVGNMEEFVDCCMAMERGESRGLDLDCEGRDGLFDDGQLFAVWERADIEALIERLRRTVDPLALDPIAVIDAACRASGIPLADDYEQRLAEWRAYVDAPVNPADLDSAIYRAMADDPKAYRPEKP